jgi:dolichol-phosphate mannosyltransferase
MIYILLPAYNEEEDIKFLLPKLNNYFNSDLKLDFQIIVCNDGSKDTTLPQLEKLKSDGYPLTILNHSINRGLGETIRDLFEYAAEVSNPEDILIRMDCDDTHDPAFIKGLIDKIESGCDVVIASRFVEGGGQTGLNAYRTTISMLANRFMRLFFPIKGLKEYSSGYRAYRAQIIKDAVNVFGNSFIQLKGLGFSCTLEKVVKLKLLGAKFGEAPMVLRYDQKRGASKMVGSVTTLGYMVLVLLYHWPWGGWKSQYKDLQKTKI